MTSVLVTPRSITGDPQRSAVELSALADAGFDVVYGPAGRLPTEPELLDLVRGVDGWIAGVERISSCVLEAADRLRVIARNGIGAESIDLDAAARLNVEVVLAAGANARGVAELAFAQILACLRNVPESDRALHDGRWTRAMGRELPETTIGLVGYGAIGRLVAGFATAFGAPVLAVDPVARIPAESGVQQVELDELFARAEVVSLHSPPPADGSPIVDRRRLAMLAPGAILVNTARSSLVDDEAVLHALTSGRLSWYAVDAFDVEPPDPSPLLRHPRSLLTPHLGGYTVASTARATARAVEALVARLDPRQM